MTSAADVAVQDEEPPLTLSAVEEKLERRVRQNQAELQRVHIQLERIEKLLLHLCGGGERAPVRPRPSRTLSSLLGLPPIPRDVGSDDEASA